MPRLRVSMPPDPNPRTPAFKAPPGSCDTHCHVFGPPETFRYAPFFNTLLDRGIYAPPSAFETWFVSTALTDDDFQRAGQDKLVAIQGGAPAAQSGAKSGAQAAQTFLGWER